MEYESLSDEFSKYPEIIRNSIEMLEPNQSVNIYKGSFHLRHGVKIVDLEGSIYYDWFPLSGTKFKGLLTSSFDENFKHIRGTTEPVELFIGSSLVGKCYVTKASIANEIRLEGQMVSEAVYGDKSVTVSKLRFAIPNMSGFLGTTVNIPSEKSLRSSKCRITFTTEHYEIILDKHRDYDKLSKLLDDQGGYLILYYGEITKKKGSFSFDEMKEIVYSLSIFLTFLNGKRTSPIFVEGIHDGKVLWTDYSDHYNEQHRFVPSWPYRHSTDGLNEMWQKFNSYWKDEATRNFLETAVHWYVEANKQTGFFEGSIIMAQADLELIYNWLLIETKKLLIGKDAEGINAANKIRLLLSSLNVNPTIPLDLINLQASSDFIDGPEAIVQIRNALVHGQEEKRKKLTSISSKVKYETLTLALWYIELSLLYILDHKGLYLNRCVTVPNINNKLCKVPWVE